VEKLAGDLKQPLVELLLSVADDKFVLGHRNADWTGLAPILEEDIAFSSLSQDEISHATALYQIVAGFIGSTPDKLAYARRPEEYRCAALVELSDDFDWAVALCRNFFCDHHDFLRLGRLAHSSYTPVAHLAGRLVAEEEIHVRHVDALLKRLGRGDQESHDRMQRALDQLAPLASELQEPTAGIEQLEAHRVYPPIEPGMFERWSAELKLVAEQSDLRLDLKPAKPGTAGGRRGRHSPAFAALLDELTEVYRLEPEAAW
jgi:ring-1,2-phenylacetyl-CoA epoxidase subunit PaaC